ncbi:hypothetical protein DSN97_08615 [Deferribacteraceae bacterium V6Fe1]|nr:hypothetical protein DSN97_08615 [Deferribacteraceae bacterium V6Fe1]
MKYIIFILFLLPNLLFADRIFFKIAVDESHYSSFEFSEIENVNKNLHFIFSKYQDLYFDINKTKKEFYNIKKKSNIKFNGKSVMVYELFPVFKDRFSQILWVNKNSIVRKEVYDLDGKLMYAYGHTGDMPENEFEASNENEEFVKKEFKNFGYRGFDIKMVKRLSNGALHILYDDGINNFSIFKTTPAIMKKEVKRIILGNYVYSTNLDNSTYTVVGTIPYSEMNEVIKFIKDKKIDTKGGK